MSGVLTGTIAPVDAAAKLGISRQRVGQLIQGGKLPAIRTPLGPLLRVKDVEALAKEREEAIKGGEAKSQEHAAEFARQAAEAAACSVEEGLAAAVEAANYQKGGFDGEQAEAQDD